MLFAEIVTAANVVLVYLALFRHGGRSKWVFPALAAVSLMAAIFPFVAEVIFLIGSVLSLSSGVAHMIYQSACGLVVCVCHYFSQTILPPPDSTAVVLSCRAVRVLNCSISGLITHSSLAMSGSLVSSISASLVLACYKLVLVAAGFFSARATDFSHDIYFPSGRKVHIPCTALPHIQI